MASFVVTATKLGLMAFQRLWKQDSYIGSRMLISIASFWSLSRPRNSRTMNNEAGDILPKCALKLPSFENCCVQFVSR